jgi:ATP-dependent Clp protease ATP-binding subunit ClpA
MFERFSMRARQAVFIARRQSGAVGCLSIDTEHLLPGLMRVDGDLDGRTGGILAEPAIRSRVQQWHTPVAAIKTSQDLPISEDLSRALNQADVLARQLECREIRTEHLLLAMMLEPTCHAAIILVEGGAKTETAKAIAEGLDCEKVQPGIEFSGEEMGNFFQ